MTQFTTPPARALPEHRRSAIRRQLETVVAARRHRRGPLLIAASVAVVAAGTSAGAYAYVARTQSLTNKGWARCYAVASLSAGPQSFTSIAVATLALSGRPGQMTDARDMCASLWNQGFIHAGPQGAGAPSAAPSPGANYPVPPLVTCVLADGTAAVFPGSESTCTTLGLPSASG